MIKFESGQTVYSRKVVFGPLKIIGLSDYNGFSVDHYICEGSDGTRYCLAKLYLSTKPIVETD
jgi:hypothetical protein